MNQEEQKTILELHRKWVINYVDGKRADLRGAYLEGVNLEDADLKPIKRDFFQVLETAKAECLGLYDASAK
jgi:uncharacterized protein YjbI with pentapeptide repeats